ncbi:hypothetical protein RYH80_17670 [Halobaculum sp. MBLA0147]|uniref:hypothetical protein n=1 Tax=Halobaculum sp. MBLA0147 TaxID=3079934 RepID=UPI0035232EB4
MTVQPSSLAFLAVLAIVPVLVYSLTVVANTLAAVAGVLSLAVLVATFYVLIGGTDDADHETHAETPDSSGNA